MKLLLMLLVAFPTASFTQKTAIFVDTLATKAELFSKSLIWIAKTWKEANNVIQLKDENSGTIIVKGGLASVPKALGVAADGITMSDVTIQVKDGKWKITFEDTNFRWRIGTLWTFDNTPATNKKGHEKWKDSVLAEIDTLIASYKASTFKKIDDF